MKTFDYARAWREAAKPAFDSLPEQVHQLLELVTELYKDEHQQRDLSMRFINADVRAAFDAIDTETLAHASRAIYFYGHWRPGNAPTPQRSHGETWKFSSLADQVLSVRLGLPAPHLPTPRSGWSIRVDSGALRLHYSAWNARRTDIEFTASKDIGYASEQTLKIANSEASSDGSYEAVQATLRRAASFGRPKGDDPFALLFGTSDRYMVEEDVIKQREYDYQREIVRIRAAHDARVKKALDTTERDGMVWLLEHSIPIDNVIYYDHTGRFCFGWSRPVSAAFYSRLVDVLVEFPYDYDIKQEAKR